MDYNDAPPPKKGMSPWLIVLLVGFGLCCLCCGGMFAWGMVKAPEVIRQAESSMAEIEALTTRVETEFGEPEASIGINRNATMGQGTSTVLTLTLVGSPVPPNPITAREERARTIARAVMSWAPTTWGLTSVCIAYSDLVGGTAISHSNFCFGSAELASGNVPPVPPFPVPAPAPAEAPVPPPTP